MLLSDGMSHLMLDFSLHREEVKELEQETWSHQKVREAWFSENHKGWDVARHIWEYSMKKTGKAIEIVKYDIRGGILFDYLLMGRWFTNAGFVRLITSRHIKCNLSGMIKLCKTR